MFAVQVRNPVEANEELAPVGVGARVGHGHRHGVVWQPLRAVFIGKRGRPEDGIRASAVSFNKVTSLDKKTGYDSVKARVFVPDGGVVDPGFSGTELPEVFRRSLRFKIGQPGEVLIVEKYTYLGNLSAKSSIFTRPSETPPSEIYILLESCYSYKEKIHTHLRTQLDFPCLIRW